MRLKGLKDQIGKDHRHLITILIPIEGGTGGLVEEGREGGRDGGEA